MSYGAILGIAILLPALEWCFPGRWKWLSGCHTSIAVNIMLFPITLWFFYVFPTYSFLVNLFVLPLTGPILGIGFLGSFLLLWIPFLGELCLHLCGFILNFFEWICRVGNELPYARLVLGQPDCWEMMLYYVALLGILFVLSYAEKKKWRRTRYRLVCFGLCFAIGLMAYQPNGMLNITMLDVGQGDGIYLRGPKGTTYFIDGGSSDESGLGKNCIEPFLESQGTGTLDYVFISHGDSDHYSGIEEMLERQEVGIRIRNLVLPVNYSQDESLIDLAKKAKESEVNVLTICEGDVIRDTNMQIACWQPAKEDRQLTDNAGSMVLEIQYGEFSMLCTGDVEGDGEKLLTQKMKGKNYDVLKVAHHGSKYSTSDAFLKLSSPDIALISAGKDNRYGHPHEELLRRLQNAGCKIYNTQEHGAIRLQTDGKLLGITPLRVKKWSK